MQFSTNDEPHVMRRATALAIETGQHLFDTLYHTVALESEDANLITANDRYRQRTESHGRLIALHDWAIVR